MAGKRERQFPSKISTTAFAKLYILHLLKERSFYGNEIIDEINTRLSFKWEPSPGLIYPMLRQLESEGYIEGWWLEPVKRSKRYYKITPEGFEHYKKIKLMYRASFDDSLTIINGVLGDIYNEKK